MWKVRLSTSTAIGADDREGRMRDVDDIEQAERNGGAHAERRVEAAEQQPGDHGVDEERIGYRHDARLCSIGMR